MEGKFKSKYASKEEFDFAVENWTNLMEEWKNADTEFKRDIKITTDDATLTIIIKLSSNRNLNI